MSYTTTDKLTDILKNASNYNEFLDSAHISQKGISLTEYFDYLFDQRQCKKADVIRNALIDPYYAYQILRGEKNASRDKLIQIALAFPLTVKETQLLLYLGGHQKLYIKNKRDSVFLFALEKNLTMEQISELLSESDQAPLI